MVLVYALLVTGFVRRHVGEGRGQGRGVVPLHQALGRDGRQAAQRSVQDEGERKIPVVRARGIGDPRAYRQSTRGG